MIRTALTITVSVAALVVGAGGAWLTGGGTALAPEPARLTASLSGTNGAAASAYYVNTGHNTTAIKWPGSWIYNTSIAAGTACSTVELPAGTEVRGSIQASPNGNYRRCV